MKDLTMRIGLYAALLTVVLVGQGWAFIPVHPKPSAETIETIKEATGASKQVDSSPESSAGEKEELAKPVADKKCGEEAEDPAAAEKEPLQASGQPGDLNQAAGTDETASDDCGVPMADIDPSALGATDAARTAAQNGTDKNEAFRAYFAANEEKLKASGVQWDGAKFAELNEKFNLEYARTEDLLNRAKEAAKNNQPAQGAFDAFIADHGVASTGGDYTVYGQIFNQEFSKAGGQGGVQLANVAPSVAATNVASPGGYVPTTDYSYNGGAPQQPGMNTGQGGVLQNLLGGLQSGLGGNTGARAANSPCPAGTQLANYKGQIACVGVKDDEEEQEEATADCIKLYDKNFCPENDCRGETRERITIGNKTYCTKADGSSTLTAADRGKADGKKNIAGRCGKVIGENDTSNQAYLEAYARGVVECRSEAKPGNYGETDASGDVDVRERCGAQLEATATAASMPRCVLEMTFRPQSSLTGAPRERCGEGEGTTEADVLGYDGTRYFRAIMAKTQFEAGKLDAMRGKSEATNLAVMPVAYAQGYACGNILK